jgi:hypothetical protein
MPSLVAASREVSKLVLEHLLRRIESTPALDEPFSHIYLENVFPQDIYERMLNGFPRAELYTSAAERYYNNADDKFVRSMCMLTQNQMARFGAEQHELWRGIAGALTAPDLKTAMFKKLAKDLAFRYGIPKSKVGELAGYSRPTLYRETDGFEIPPHPDTRKKVVTMQLYLPADHSQLDLGTALYQRKLLAWPFAGWKQRFEKVKQFSFQPNSGYAFVVNNTLTKKSWHGREKLPHGAGVRNTLLATFYDSPRQEFSGYLVQTLAAFAQRA